MMVPFDSTVAKKIHSRSELERETERLPLVERHIEQLEAMRRARLLDPRTVTEPAM
jgi:hypothetical protein